VTGRASALLVLLASPLLARAAEASAEAVSPPPPAPAAAAPVAEVSRKGFHAEVGWGYYEVLHVGVAYHVNDDAAFDLFGGLGPGGGARTGTVGLGFRQALWSPVREMPWGLSLKALYWRQSDSNYDWDNMSVVLGAFIERDLDRRLSLKLDGGAALSFALQSDRKQNQQFGTPQRWNGSVCLELVYRLGAR
jgi:hypothetical protein